MEQNLAYEVDRDVGLQERRMKGKGGALGQGGDYFNDYLTRAFSNVVWYVKSEYGFVFFLSCHLTPPTRGSKIAFLHYKSFLKSASNGLKFSIYLVHRIIRPMVKKLAQSDCRFSSYSICLVFLGRFFKNGPNKPKKCRNS